MKCIDAIEGTVKSILTQMHVVCKEDHLDDTEYVRYAKAIIDATDIYTRNNPELVEDPKLLEHVLYIYSRDLWLNGQTVGTADQVSKNPDADADNGEYQTYYYDYLYHRGLYPR